MANNKLKQEKLFEVLTEFQPDHVIFNLERDNKGKKELKYGKKAQKEMKSLVECTEEDEVKEKDVKVGNYTLRK